MTPFSQLPRPTRAFLCATVSAGAIALAAALGESPVPSDARALVFILLAIGAGFVRVPLPVGGTLSPAYAFVLATLMSFGLGASVLASVASAVVTSLVPLPGQDGTPTYRTAFNAGCVALASSSSGLLYLAAGGPVGSVEPVRDVAAILAGSAGFSIVNLGLISIAIHLSGSERAAPVLRANYLWSVPAFLASSSLATLLALLVQRNHLELILLAAPFVYLMHLAYRARSRQSEEERRHSQETAEHYRAVTKALALAIEAKDESTEDHLRRVQLFSVATAKALGLDRAEMEALEAASLLHDIGKIAVPERILTKPGRLSPEEAERMKVHPTVGAEILGAVPFPFPLAPIVRHHHERWDGKGYPDGLEGEAIPIGARVLSVADCFDALTSDRPYRKALPVEEAEEFLRRESGRMFDPAVVRAFLASPEVLSQAARSGGAPQSSPAAPNPAVIAAENHDARTAVAASDPHGPSDEDVLFRELARTAALRLDLEDGLALLSSKIDRLVPFRSLVVYLYDREREHLVARFASGQAAARLRGLMIPVGERIAGWVALQRRTYVGTAHARPLDRDGSRSDLEDLVSDSEAAELRSAIVTPLTTGFEDLGALALYHTGSHVYGDMDVRRLESASGFVARAIAGCRVAPRPESLTDSATGIPNSRFFFLESGCRIDHASRDGSAFGVVAFRLAGLDAVHGALGATASARFLVQVARRLAAATRAGETLVRFDGCLFLVLTPQGTPAILERRSEEILGEVLWSPAETRFGIPRPVDLQVAFASYPYDGDTTEKVLDAIERRLDAQALARTPAQTLPGRDEGRGSLVPDVV